MTAQTYTEPNPVIVTGPHPPVSVLTPKIDRITELQDGVDSLSLAMFEALRGLRDAVAPESGNLGGITGNSTSSVNNESSEPDLEEMWQAYRSGDPETLAMVKKATTSVPQKREDFVRIHAKMEMEKDAELVKKLAESVLEKSANIDFRVSHILGMERTRAQQMIYIEDLMQKNHEVSERLQQAYSKASERRDVVRKFVKDLTCEALGIEEGTN